MNYELLYTTFNRLAFCRESLHTVLLNTNWNLISKMVFYDDGSTDGTREYIEGWRKQLSVPSDVREKKLGGPVAVMRDFIPGTTEFFIKLDSDVILPPGWLDTCNFVMVHKQPWLDILGIEPPASRTPSPRSFARGKRMMRRTEETRAGSPTAIPCPNIGGIGLMKRAPFMIHGSMTPHDIYGGFTEWQNRNRHVGIAWIAPPLKVFLLDRLPMDPWRKLSDHYIHKGWQRPWTNYEYQDHEALWDWWKPMTAQEPLCQSA